MIGNIENTIKDLLNKKGINLEKIHLLTDYTSPLIVKRDCLSKEEYSKEECVLKQGSIVAINDFWVIDNNVVESNCYKFVLKLNVLDLELELCGDGMVSLEFEANITDETIYIEKDSTISINDLFDVVPESDELASEINALHRSLNRYHFSWYEHCRETSSAEWDVEHPFVTGAIIVAFWILGYFINSTLLFWLVAIICTALMLVTYRDVIKKAKDAVANRVDYNDTEKGKSQLDEMTALKLSVMGMIKQREAIRDPK